MPSLILSQLTAPAFADLVRMRRFAACACSAFAFFELPLNDPSFRSGEVPAARPATLPSRVRSRLP